MQIAEIGGGAEEGLLIGMGLGVLAKGFGGEFEPKAGVADLVQGEVGEGNVLFEDGGMPGPFGEAVAGDEFVVGEGEGVSREGGVHSFSSKRPLVCN